MGPELEPQPLGPARPIPRRAEILDHSRDLWRRAPAWRLLVGSTGALFVASVATGVLSLQHESPAPAAIHASPADRAPRVATIPPKAFIPLPAPVAPQPAPAEPPLAQPLAPQTASPDRPETQSVPPPDETACRYRGGGGSGGQGRVLGFLSREQAARLLAFTQQRTRAKINPDYVSNVRAMITVPNGRRLVVLVPSGLAVKPGDRVAFASGHRDWSMACGYVPNLIIGLLQSQ